MLCPNAVVVAMDADIEGSYVESGRTLTEDIAREEGLNVVVAKALSPRDVASVVREHLAGGPIDFVLIDGLHVNTQLLRDFMAISQHASQSCVFVLHDVLNWHMLSAFDEIAALPGYTARILTRSPSGMAVVYKEIPASTADIIDCYVDETVDPRQWIVSEGGNISEPGSKLRTRLSKGYPFRHLGMAFVGAADGNWEQVHESIAQLTHENPTHINITYQAGEFLLAHEQWQEADAVFAHVQSLTPTWAHLSHHRGQINRQLKRFDEALVHFNKAAELDPVWFPPHADMGFIEMERGNAESAIQHFRHATSLNPEELFLWVELMRLHIGLGHYDAAFDCLQSAQSIAPAGILPWEELIECLPDNEYMQHAILRLEQLCHKQPNWGGARKVLGIALRKVGRLAESRQVFEYGVAHFPEWSGPGVLYELGLTCRDMGDCGAARMYLEKALTLRPSFTLAAHALAQMRL